MTPTGRVHWWSAAALGAALFGAVGCASQDASGAEDADGRHYIRVGCRDCGGSGRASTTRPGGDDWCLRCGGIGAETIEDPGLRIERDMRSFCDSCRGHSKVACPNCDKEWLAANNPFAGRADEELTEEEREERGRWRMGRIIETLHLRQSRGVNPECKRCGGTGRVNCAQCGGSGRKSGTKDD